jgi:hypothetical protein
MADRVRSERAIGWARNAQGERHEVLVAESGYLWDGRSWGSLSSIAREITGTRRNGPSFFGLRDREAP